MWTVLYYISPFVMIVAVVVMYWLNKPEKPIELKRQYDSLVQALEEEGFHEIAVEMGKMKGECMILNYDSGGGERKIGSCRIGGCPDLPKDMDWPTHDEKSLSFIAQINLFELSRYASKFGLPEDGMLYFFYDREELVGGFDPNDRGKWRVVYKDVSRNELDHRALPQDIPEQSKFGYKYVTSALEASYPDILQFDLRKFGLSKRQERKVFKVFGVYNPLDKLTHKMFGYPDQIQTDMQLECQLVSNGIYCGDPSGYNDYRVEELAKGASDWILLLQIDSDLDIGMMWGDSGRLNYWIRGNDLRDRNFDDVWLIFQCY
jgi:uncharacterized protein YwqG